MNKLLSLPVVMLLALLSCVLPLTVYFLSLSLFGLPHIYYELQYVTKRFQPEFSTSLVAVTLFILAAIVVIKFVGLWYFIPHMVTIELGLVGLLIAVACVYQPHPLVVLLLGLFALGVMYFPVILFLLLAFLHNLTPLGFFKVERHSHRVLTNFVIIPLVVFVCASLLNSHLQLGHYIDYALYPATTAQAMLKHYIPMSWIAQASEPTMASSVIRGLFSVAVFYQLMHYDSTIRVLPSFLPKHKRSWNHNLFRLGSYVIFFIATIGLWVAFVPTKQSYGIIAAFHAWLEVPLLLILLLMPKEDRNNAVLQQ